MSHAQDAEAVRRSAVAGVAQRRARVARRSTGPRGARRVRRLSRADDGRRRRQPDPRRDDARPARTPGHARTPPARVDRDRDRARDPHRRGHRHGRGRRHGRHDLARGHPASRPRPQPDGSDQGGDSAAADLLGLEAISARSKSGSSPTSSSSMATRRPTFADSRRRNS